jgi:hypothetical protein
MLNPTFSLTIGALASSTDNAVGGPQRFVVTRDTEIAADALQVVLMDRAGLSLGDAPGEAVELQLGHDGENETVFVGHVVELQPRLSGVQVTALGRMQLLLNLRTAAWYEGQTAGGIARDLIDQAELEAGTVDEGPELPRFAVDRRLSAYAHLKQLANRLGFECYAKRDGKVCFHGLGAGAGLDGAGGLLGAATGAVSGLLGGGGEGYQFGQHLLAARARRRVPAWDGVIVGGESPMSGQGGSSAHWLTVNDADYLGSAGSEGGLQLLVIDPVARTKDIADRFAAGWLATGQAAAHEVTITVFGRPQVDLGDTVEIGGAPDDLINGSGYIRALRHRFDAEIGFVTELRVALSAA